jgi:hypothetical protein
MGDLSSTLFIVMGFMSLIVVSAISVGIREIEKNWVKYRCNPGVMIGVVLGVVGNGQDPQENFMYCIQNTQSGYMKYLMVPFNYMFSIIGDVANQLVKNIQSIRDFVDKLRERILRAIQDVMGVVLNVIIAFQKIIISMRDMMNKLVGIFATVLHLMLGCLMTVKSMWAGVAGVLVRSLGTA